MEDMHPTLPERIKSAPFTIEVVDPLALIKPTRLDYVLKHLYACSYYQRGKALPWIRDLYASFVRLMTGGIEPDRQTKFKIEDFMNAYDCLLEDIGTNGLDPESSVLPMNQHLDLFDGSHRGMAAAALGLPVSAAKYQTDYSPTVCDWQYFKRQGIDSAWLEYLAARYVSLKRHECRLLFVDEKCTRLPKLLHRLRSTLNVIYLKRLAINNARFTDFARELETQFNSNPEGILDLLKGCKKKSDSLSLCVLALEPKWNGPETNLEQMFSNIPELRDAPHWSPSDTNTMIAMVQTFFNENSVFAAGRAHVAECHKRIHRELKEEHAMKLDTVCITGETVVSVLCGRTVPRYEYIATNGFRPAGPGRELDPAQTTPDGNKLINIVTNPRCHFHHFGLKFATLTIVLQCQPNLKKTIDPVIRKSWARLQRKRWVRQQACFLVRPIVYTVKRTCRQLMPKRLEFYLYQFYMKSRRHK